MVLNRGSIVEQGTHNELLSNVDGAYRKHLAAQTLFHGEQRSIESAFDAQSMDAVPAGDLAKREPLAAAPTESFTSNECSNSGIFSSLVMSLYEQRKHWLGFLILLVCCMIGGV